jgi:hypothetical protein
MASPWIFAGRDRPSRRERIDLALQQLGDMARFKGERTGMLEMRRYLGLYFGELPRHSPLMQRLLNTASLPELADLLLAWRDRPERLEEVATGVGPSCQGDDHGTDTDPPAPGHGEPGSDRSGGTDR